MNKIIISLLAAASLVACQVTESETQEGTNHDTENHDIIETEETEEENSGVIETMEDYAAYNSKEALLEAFGEEHLEDGESWYAEGTVKLKHTMVTNPANGHKVKYVWGDNASDLGSIEFRYTLYDNETFEVAGTQTIPSEMGVSTGMELDKLVSLNNGKAIKFYGFGWDYGGIGVHQSMDFLPDNCSVSLAYKDLSGIPTELLGDVELSSDAENISPEMIVVDQVTYFFEK